MIKKSIGLVFIVAGVLSLLREAFFIGGLATVFGCYLAGLDETNEE